MNSSVQSIQSTAAGLLRILVADDNDLGAAGAAVRAGKQR